MPGWNLADVFEAVVDAVGPHEAVVGDHGRSTFSDLDRRANQLAHVLVSRGVGPGDRVGVQLRNGQTYLEVMLAAFKLRAVPVNVHYRYTVEELAYLFTDADLSVVVHEADLADRVRAAATSAGLGLQAIAAGDEYEQALAGAPDHRPISSGGPRSGDDRYILYTGGTTGMPKGVIWRHEDLFLGALSGGNPGGDPPADLAAVATVARRARTRCLPASPFTHGTAHWTALATLLGGGCVVVSPAGALRPESLWDLVAAERVTLLVIVGDAFALPLLDALDREPDRWDLSALLSVVSGGAVLSPTAHQGLLRHLPWSVVVDGYGTSETGGHGHMAVWPGQVPSGRPRFEVGDDTAVFDEHLEPVQPGSGAVGHLARRGHIPIGYHNDPERTARTFPVIRGERWAVPGDLAVVEADGRVALLGRGSSSINSGGEKVFPDEVEATLKSHPDVFDALVVGTPDERWGEVVTAIVQPRAGTHPAPDDLVEHCRAHLAGFKAPRRIVFVPSVVRRSSGKPDYGWARAVVAGDAVAG